MDNLYCPTCGVELMEHEESAQFDEWVWTIVYKRPLGEILPPRYGPGFSSMESAALKLMNKVWEMDPKAAIYRNDIVVGIMDTGNVWNYRTITGPTFPLRVCRAAIWLAVHGDRNG